jgi:hypothetical protein
MKTAQYKNVHLGSQELFSVMDSHRHLVSTITIDSEKTPLCEPKIHQEIRVQSLLNTGDKS